MQKLVDFLHQSVHTFFFNFCPSTGTLIYLYPLPFPLPLCLVKPKSDLIKKIKSTKMAMGSSEVQVLSPHEDSISIPMTSRQTIDDKKEQIKYFFRITIVWREETFQLGSSIAVLSLRGR